MNATKTNIAKVYNNIHTQTSVNRTVYHFKSFMSIVVHMYRYHSQQLAWPNATRMALVGTHPGELHRGVSDQGTSREVSHQGTGRVMWASPMWKSAAPSPMTVPKKCWQYFHHEVMAKVPKVVAKRSNWGVWTKAHIVIESWSSANYYENVVTVHFTCCLHGIPSWKWRKVKKC